MNTLYDLLGLGRGATAEQIEGAYKQQLNALEGQETLAGSEALNKIRIIRDAYLVLSNPARRQAYDEKLKSKQVAVTYEVVEARPIPWLLIILVSFTVFSGWAYVHQSNLRKERLAQQEAEAQKERAEAEKAQAVADAAQAELARLALVKRQQEEADNRRLAQQVEYEGRQIDAAMERANREKARQEQLDQMEKSRREREAQARVQEQNAKWERAIRMPVSH